MDIRVFAQSGLTTSHAVLYGRDGCTVDNDHVAFAVHLFRQVVAGNFSSLAIIRSDGHIGMTPQSIHRFGGPKVQGRADKSKQYLLESAQAIEEAGAYSIVLELIQSDTSAEITKSVGIPTIGIGAGPHCDGQVLVINDILGLYDIFKPKFVRRYADLPAEIEKAAKAYIDDVRAGRYPSDEESF